MSESESDSDPCPNGEPRGKMESRGSIDDSVSLSEPMQQTLVRNKNHHQKSLLESKPESKYSIDEGISLCDSQQQTQSLRRINSNHRESFLQSKSVFTKLAVGIAFVIALCAIVAAVVVVTQKKQFCDDCPSPCPPDWIWFQKRCYFVSETESNWTSSQRFCSSYGASLARISNEERTFIRRLKGRDRIWIGLKRAPGQPWKWLNGENATLEVLGDGGDCAYLDNNLQASSSMCSIPLHWMCSKPDASEKSN